MATHLIYGQGARCGSTGRYLSADARKVDCESCLKSTWRVRVLDRRGRRLSPQLGPGFDTRLEAERFARDQARVDVVVEEVRDGEAVPSKKGDL